MISSELALFLESSCTQLQLLLYPQWRGVPSCLPWNWNYRQFVCNVMINTQKLERNFDVGPLSCVAIFRIFFFFNWATSILTINRGYMQPLWSEPVKCYSTGETSACLQKVVWEVSSIRLKGGVLSLWTGVLHFSCRHIQEGEGQASNGKKRDTWRRCVGKVKQLCTWRRTPCVGVCHCSGSVMCVQLVIGGACTFPC